MVPSFGAAAAVILVTVLAGLGLTATYGRETRGRDLRELEDKSELRLTAAQ